MPGSFTERAAKKAVGRPGGSAPSEGVVGVYISVDLVLEKF